MLVGTENMANHSVLGKAMAHRSGSLIRSDRRS